MSVSQTFPPLASFVEAVENVCAWDNIRTFDNAATPWSRADYDAASAYAMAMVSRSIDLVVDLRATWEGRMSREAFSDKYPDV